MVQDTFLTETAKKADIVFPLVVYPEIDGTFINTDRRVQLCSKAVEAPIEYRTSEIAQKIAEIFEDSVSAGTASDLCPKAKPGGFLNAPVLYVGGFGFPDKKAKLQVVGESAMFESLALTCSLLNAVDADLPV